MRDRTRSRNYSPERDDFRRLHEKHRAWGLQQRHGRKLQRLRQSRAEPQTPHALKSPRPHPPPVASPPAMPSARPAPASPALTTVLPGRALAELTAPVAAPPASALPELAPPVAAPPVAAPPAAALPTSALLVSAPAADVLTAGELPLPAPTRHVTALLAPALTAGSSLPLQELPIPSWVGELLRAESCWGGFLLNEGGCCTLLVTVTLGLARKRRARVGHHAVLGHSTTKPATFLPASTQARTSAIFRLPGALNPPRFTPLLFPSRPLVAAVTVTRQGFGRAGPFADIKPVGLRRGLPARNRPPRAPPSTTHRRRPRGGAV
jgi:hypothetical protein